MKRDAFEYVYIHANCMAELGLERAARRMAAMEPAVDELAHLSPEEREALVLKQLGQMQASSDMHQAMPWDSPELRAQMEHNLQQLQAQDEQIAKLNAQAAEPLPADLLADLEAAAAEVDAHIANEHGSDAADGGQTTANAGRDLDQYLQRAYAAKDQIAARVDDGMARIDMKDLDIMMFAVPEDIAPLTGPMKGKDLEKWMEVYHLGFYAVNEVVRMVRAL